MAGIRNRESCRDYFKKNTNSSSSIAIYTVYINVCSPEDESVQQQYRS